MLPARPPEGVTVTYLQVSFPLRLLQEYPQLGLRYADALTAKDFPLTPVDTPVQPIPWVGTHEPYGAYCMRLTWPPQADGPSLIAQAATNLHDAGLPFESLFICIRREEFYGA